MDFITKIRIILWTGLAVLTAWLLSMAVVPTGRVSYVYDFTKPNYFIKKLTPEERLAPLAGGAQAVKGDPVYFALRTQRTFDTARLTIKFRNPDKLPIIEAGVLVDKKIWRYDTRPLENKVIDELAQSWTMTREGETVLLQKEKRYDSIKDFLDKPPAESEIALYNYDWDREYLLPGYEKKEKENIINQPLRGAYQFYTYIKDEDLDFKFSLLDLNQNKDSDPIELKLYYRDQLIDSAELSDDGVREDNGKMSEARELRLREVNLPEGVYKIELVINDDIVTSEIKTKQEKLSFINKIWLMEKKIGESLPPLNPTLTFPFVRGGEESITLYTDSRTINAQTINPAKLQTITVGSSSLVVSETYRQFSLSSEGSFNEIKLAKDDTIVSGDGVFSFSSDALINPNLKKVIAGFDSQKERVSYVLADYNFPENAGDGWQTAQAEFNLKNAYREFYKYSFLISIPGLRADDEVNDKIEIGEIRVDLRGTTLLEKIKKIFNKS